MTDLMVDGTDISVVLCMCICASARSIVHDVGSTLLGRGMGGTENDRRQ